jgi:serine/threonine protein kinase
MPVIPGDRLRPYEIVEPLGHGGMGEVHRARDTRLRRQVAIKTISSRSGIDAEARERFDREARAGAAWRSRPRAASRGQVLSKIEATSPPCASRGLGALRSA